MRHQRSGGGASGAGGLLQGLFKNLLGGGQRWPLAPAAGDFQ